MSEFAHSSVSPRVWHHSEIVSAGVRALKEGGERGAPLVDGRVLSVKATPANSTSSSMTLGVAVLPPSFRTPPHSHEAEELATILSGEGAIVIDDVSYPVRPGSVVLTPAWSRHVTVVGPDEPLVVWWAYAPPGSEDRWLAAGAIEED